MKLKYLDMDQVKIPRRGLSENIKKGPSEKLKKGRVEIPRKGLSENIKKGPSEKVSVHSSVQSGGSSSLDLFARSRRSTTHHNAVHCEQATL